MNFYKHEQDKISGDGLAITEWNTLSAAIGGSSGLHLALDSADKVGIGTTEPTSKLHIQGNTVVTGKLGVGTTNPTSELHVKASGEVGILESTTDTAYLQLYTKEGAGKRVEFCNRPGGRAAIYVNGSGDVLNVLANGSVGIGTVEPTQRLEVNGTVKATSFVGNGAGLTNLSVGETGLNLATRSGNVGVGINSPTNKLHVHSQPSGSYSAIAKFSSNANTTGVIICQKDGFEHEVALRNVDGNLTLVTHGNVNRMTIQRDGNVGIGIDTPTQKLEINGTVKATRLKIGDWEIYESGTELVFSRNGAAQIKFDGDEGRRIWSAHKVGNSNWMDES